jgi:hypothetical protein
VLDKLQAAQGRQALDKLQAAQGRQALDKLQAAQGRQALDKPQAAQGRRVSGILQLQPGNQQAAEALRSQLQILFFSIQIPPYINLLNLAHFRIRQYQQPSHSVFKRFRLYMKSTVLFLINSK